MRAVGLIIILSLLAGCITINPHKKEWTERNLVDVLTREGVLK